MSKIELVPEQTTIKSVNTESNDVMSFVLTKGNGGVMPAQPGQFVEVSIPGIGESTFAISRLSSNNKDFTVSVKRMGHLTKMLHRTASGEKVGVRGPYGNHFPLEEWKGKDIVIIGGGIGLAPLRPVIDYLRAHRDDYGHIDIVFGARSPQDIIYKDDLAEWENDSTISLYTTIDIPAEGWGGRVGFVPNLVKELSFSTDNKKVIICGPPIMIKLTVQALLESKWPRENIFTTLEMKMQCGIGQCGRCNIGGIMICKDGPVFSLDQIPDYAL